MKFKADDNDIEIRKTTKEINGSWCFKTTKNLTGL